MLFLLLFVLGITDEKLKKHNPAIGKLFGLKILINLKEIWYDSWVAAFYRYKLIDIWYMYIY